MNFTKRKIAIILLVSAVCFAFVTYMLVDIYEKKQQWSEISTHILPITDDVDDPAIWGASFPHQYSSYLKTADQVRTKYGGSEAEPRTPTKNDPRSVVSQSRIEEDVRLKQMWAGYAFAKDFREERGHAYMLTDQIYTERQNVVTQPGTCLNCHASTYKYMKQLGEGDLFNGFHKMNKMTYKEAVKGVQHPVSCIDCHTPKTMKLRVTRPAFIEGLKNFKKTQGISEYDIEKMASPAEMRVFVCAQCHVEYYFKGEGKTLTFPWNKGLKVDQIYSYYEEVKHKDWVHKITGAPVLKAQHPEFELYSQGIHARSGVSCVDCHMPYEKVGAMKITNHHIQSPLLNIAKACQTCHRWPEDELRSRVETIQSNTYEMRGIAMDALMDFINEVKKAKDAGLSDERLSKVYSYQRKAQFYLDFIEAENSMGFHAPSEALRILGHSIDETRKGQQELKTLTK